MSQEIVIDGSGAILGRLASYAAKQALLGNKVNIVNCTGVMISGNRRATIEKYQARRARGRGAQRGPHFPNIPERVVKRAIRGMLPHRQERGLKAFKLVRCYNDIPVAFAQAKTISFKTEKEIPMMSLEELKKEL